MDITVYLPDDLGQWAKESKINMSRMLRDQIQVERDRRQAVAGILADSKTTELPVEDEDVGYCTMRMHGTSLVRDGDFEVFLGQDEKLYLYDGEKLKLHSDVEAADLHRWLVEPAVYQVLRRLGVKPVFDVGLPTR